MKVLSLAVIVLFSISAWAGGPPPQAATCTACHGADGNPAIATYPVLAGKSEKFIIAQLEKFEKGKMTKKPTVMASMVAAVKDPAAKKAVAKWYSSQKCKKRCDEAAWK